MRAVFDRKFFIIIIASVSLLVFPAAFEYRPTAPVGLFPFLQAVKDAAAPGQFLVEAYSPFAATPAVSSSVSRPYSADELLAQQISAVLPLKGFGLAAFWSSFGMSGYRENVFSGSAGVSFARKAALGVGYSWYNLGIQGGELDVSKNFFDVSASFVARPFDWLEVGCAAEKISAFFKDNSYLKPVWAAGIGLKPFEGFSLLYNISGEDTAIINTLAVTAHILPFMSVSLGYGRENMTWAGSISFLIKKISVSYGMRRHPYLETTHMIAVSLRAKTVPLPSIRYTARDDVSEENPFRKIDINTCGDDEIMDIPDISEMHALRIIKYRKMIGPVSEKALIQLGFSARETVQLQRYIYGLAEDNTVPKAPVKINTYAQKQKQNQASRNMFMALVDELGINPTEAMDLCAIAAKEGRAGFRKKISTMQKLSETDKQKAEAICARYW